MTNFVRVNYFIEHGGQVASFVYDVSKIEAALKSGLYYTDIESHFILDVVKNDRDISWMEFSPNTTFFDCLLEREKVLADDQGVPADRVLYIELCE